MALMNGYFPGVDMYELIETAANATAESVIERIKSVYSTENSALSVVRP